MAGTTSSEDLRRSSMEENIAPGDEPFDADSTPSKPGKRAANRYSVIHTPRLSDAQATASPSQAKRALEAHMLETDRRLEEASKLGTALVQQRNELAERMKDVEKAQSERELGPELRQKLVEVEKEYHELGRETARAFLAPRRGHASEDLSQDEGVSMLRSASPTKFNARAIDSPSKMSAPSRKQRNQAGSRVHDIEFATEISTSLLAQVRQLQAALAERDDSLKQVTSEKERLLLDMQTHSLRLRSLDESEQRYKDENWSLETHRQELLASQKDAAEREQRLQHTLAVANAEKTAAQRELDEMKQAHGKLSEESAAFHKTHESELGSLRKSINFAENDRTALKKRLEELTSQNQELANYISARPNSTEPALERELLSEPDDLALDKSDVEHNSPPGSPVKGARNSMLESETLKSSLQHAHRMIQNLKNTVHREKGEKLELKRMLQETRDELDIKRQGGTIKKGKGRDLKPQSSRSGALGSSRSANTEIIEGGDWEDNEDGSTPRRVAGGSKWNTSGAEGSDAYATANETEAFDTANETDAFQSANDTDTDAGFETATERDAPTDNEFVTGNEDSAGDATETEDSSVGRTGTIRGRPTPNRPSHRSRESFHSTASTSDEDDSTPARSSKYGSMIFRSKPGGSRWSIMGGGSAQSSIKGSPASVAPAGHSLGDELGDFMDDESVEGGSVGDANTPSRTRAISRQISRNGTPHRTPSKRGLGPLTDGLVLHPTPQIPPVPKIPMVDSGIMTDTWAPEPEIREVPVDREVIKEVFVDRPIDREVIKYVDVPGPETVREVIVEKPVDREVIKEVIVEKPVDREVIKHVEVPVEVVKEVQVPFETIKEVQVPYEVIKEVQVPFETIREVEKIVHVEVPVDREVIKEVQVPFETVREVEKIVHVEVPVDREVIKEVQVPFETIREVEKIVHVEVPVDREVVKEVPVDREIVKEVPQEVVREVEKIVHVEVPVDREVIKTVEVPVEVIKEIEKIVEVPVDREVIKTVEVPVEVVKEVEKVVEVPVPYEVIKEVQVPFETIREVEKIVHVEVPVDREVIKEVQVPFETIKEVQVPYEVIKEVQVPFETIREVEVIREVKVPATPTKRDVSDMGTVMTPKKQTEFADTGSNSRDRDIAAATLPTPEDTPANSIANLRSLDEGAVDVRQPETSLFAPGPVSKSRKFEISPVLGASVEPQSVPARALEESGIRSAADISPAGEELKRPDTATKDKSFSFAPVYTPSNPPPEESSSRPATAVKENEGDSKIAGKVAGAGIIGGTLGWIGGKVSDALGGQNADSQRPASSSDPKQPLGEISNNVAGKARESIAPNQSSRSGNDDVFAPIPVRTQRSSTIAAGPESPKPALPSKSVRRPGSVNSMRRSNEVPPLPADHQKVIEAASKRNTAELPKNVTMGAMGPPLAPASAMRSNQVRSITPNDQATPAATRGNVARLPRQMHSGTAKSLNSRRSSMSSFESDIDHRFELRAAMGPYGPGLDGNTDPRMIQAITQTMIGEYLWKYTRKAGGSKMSTNRHRRFFWVHPYTRTLYWSEQDPSTAGRAQLKAKSVQIEAVRVVQDDNPFPPGLHRKSLIVLTPSGGRDLKFTAPTGMRHETWFNSLSYLLLRQNPDAAQESVAAHHNFNPTQSLMGKDMRTENDRVSLSTYNSRPATQRASRASSVNRMGSPVRGGASSIVSSSPATVRRHPPGSSAGPSPAPPSRGQDFNPKSAQGAGRQSMSIGSRISSVFRPGRQSVSSPQPPAGDADSSIYNASVVQSESAEDLRQQYEQSIEDEGGVENVRACCDGSHDVGSISRRAGSRVSGAHHHHHQH